MAGKATRKKIQAPHGRSVAKEAGRYGIRGPKSPAKPKKPKAPNKR